LQLLDIYMFVYAVEDSTLIQIFDQFCFFLFLKGSPNLALIAIMKTQCW